MKEEDGILGLYGFEEIDLEGGRFTPKARIAHDGEGKGEFPMGGIGRVFGRRRGRGARRDRGDGSDPKPDA
jgi:hypothetical protein